MDALTIVFDDWEQVLASTLPPDLRKPYREAIVKFRYWLRQTGKTPDAETFKEHLDWKKSYLSPDRFEVRRDALRWYYKEGLRRMKAAGQNPSKPLTPTGSALVPKVPPKANQAPHPASNGNPRPVFPTRAPTVPAKTGAGKFGDYRTYEMNDVPSAGARDLGGPPWERALVSRIRERNLAWTSEKTYRAWCRRFMALNRRKADKQPGP
jgi:hypothetical protein